MKKTKSTSKRPQSREIRFELLIRATPAAVWRAITDSAKVARWSYMHRVEIDRLEVGGRFLFFPKKKSAQPDVGIITKLQPVKRLVYEWHSNEPAATIVDYRLKLEGSHTRLIFVNSGFQSGKSWDALYLEDYGGWVRYHLEMASLVQESPTPKEQRL